MGTLDFSLEIFSEGFDFYLVLNERINSVHERRKYDAIRCKEYKKKFLLYLKEKRLGIKDQSMYIFKVGDRTTKTSLCIRKEMRRQSLGNKTLER